MRILLTGATGLIGTELGIQLVRAGHELVVLTRDPLEAQLNLPFPAKIYQWNYESDRIPQGALVGVEAVLHLAGEPIATGSWSEEKKARIRDSRVKSTRALVRAFSHLSESDFFLQTFILGSAIGWYGDRGQEPCSEGDEPGSDFLSQVVLEWETEGEKIARLGKDVRFVAVRTGLVLAHSGGFLSEILPVFKLGIGGRLGQGMQVMSWIHIEDLVRLFIFALERPIHGPLNAVAPEPVTNRTFTETLGAVLDLPTFLPVPRLAIETLFREKSALLLCSQRVSSERTAQTGFQFQYPNLTDALAQLLGDQRRWIEKKVFRQWIAIEPDRLWPYFTNEKNLESLTPEFLHFKVIGKSTESLQEGTRIQYRLKLRGIPVKWESHIQTWIPPKKFTDIQTSGPYKLWRHTHTFSPLGAGTLITDKILYQLPMGILGKALAGRLVGRDVDAIFRYRKQVIARLFLK